MNDHPDDHSASTWVHPVTRQRICWDCYPHPDEITITYTGIHPHPVMPPTELLPTVFPLPVVMQWTAAAGERKKTHA